MTRGFILLAVILGVVAARELQAQRRVPCTDVVHELDAITGRGGSHRADPIRVAIRLNVEPAWVEHCAQLYGRRLAKRLPRVSDEEREERQERWESEEPFEFDREDAAQGEFEPPVRRRDPRSTPTPTLEEERRMLESDNPPQ
jgi:hypothetical protein